MFATETHRSDVCRTLLSQLRLAKLWTTDGPSPECLRLAKANGGHLSTGERIMFGVAWDLWTNGEFKISFFELVQSLDQERLRCIAELMLAMKCDDGGRAVGNWLSVWSLPPRPTLPPR